MFKEEITETEREKFLESKQLTQSVYSLTGNSLTKYNQLSLHFLNRRFKNIHMYAVYCSAVYKNKEYEKDCYLDAMKKKFLFFNNTWKKISVTIEPEKVMRYHYIPKALKYEILLSPTKKKVLIVFRGSRTFPSWDWYSNFRCITQFVPFIYDHYDQVVYLIPEIVKELHKAYGEKIKIMTTGHSLGGGLAQQAAYASPFISQAYVFNTSPVTGLLNFTLLRKKTYKENLEIFRIYEHGEVLEKFRIWKNKILPFSLKNPKIEAIQFNRLNDEESAIDEHNMEKLATELNVLLEENYRFRKNYSSRDYNNQAV